MRKKILKYFTVKGFASGEDVSGYEVLEKELNEAKGTFKLAKKDLKVAKEKLNTTLEKIISKMESKKKEVKEAQKKLDKTADSSSIFDTENIKLKYEKTMAELEIRKDKIKKKIEEYNAEGSEHWDSFKSKLNHDLEELGKALKGFVTTTK